jgi:hypothetical protein
MGDDLANDEIDSWNLTYSRLISRPVAISLQEHNIILDIVVVEDSYKRD